MKIRKIIASGLLLSLLFGSMPIGFAESIDLRYVDMLTQKMSSMNGTQQNKYGDKLQIALYDKNTIQATIDSINSALSAEDKAALASKGISNDYIIDSLESLKSWSQGDRFALIDAAKANDIATVKRLNAANAETVAPTEPVVTPTTPVVTPTTPVVTPTVPVVTPTVPVVVPTTPVVVPTVPVVSMGGGSVSTPPPANISDDMLDQLLNSTEFKDLINLDNEATAKGSINSIANDSVVYAIRKGIAKSDFKLPEEVKNINVLIKVKSPKTVANKLDFINLLVQTFGDQKDIAAHTKIQSVKDIGTIKSTQINVSFLLQKSVLKKDVNGKIGAMNNLTRKDMAELLVKFLKSMGIELPKDSKKQAAMKDISNLKAADQELMNKMLTAGFLSVDKMGKIGPSANMTQGEISLIIKKVYDYYLTNYGL